MSRGPLRLPVTVVIPTLNEADRLSACLASVSWATEIIVADAGSTDGTRELAARAGARVIEVHGTTIAGQRNAAMDVATQSWVLALDADERATPELRQSLERAIAAPTADAYRIHFRNRYLGAPMERGGWGQDRHVRFSRAHLRWGVKQVHERLEYDGPVSDLSGRIDHDSYRDLAHQLSKVTAYALWGARDLQSRGGHAGFSQLVARPAWRFIKTYVVRGAWREGYRGFVLSAVDAWSGFAKYALLWDLERQAADTRAQTPTPSSTPTPSQPPAARRATVADDTTDGPSVASPARNAAR